MQVHIINQTDANGYPIWVRLNHTKEHYRVNDLGDNTDDLLDFFAEANSIASTTYDLSIPSLSQNSRMMYLYSGVTRTDITPPGALHPQAETVPGNRYVVGEREGFGNTDHSLDEFTGIGTHAHEIGHLFGLNHTDGLTLATHPATGESITNRSANVLGWGLMESPAQGPDSTSNGWTIAYKSCPNPPNAFYRMDLGWSTITQITPPGAALSRCVRDLFPLGNQARGSDMGFLIRIPGQGFGFFGSPGMLSIPAQIDLFG